MAAILYGELFYGKARRVLYKRDGGRFTPTVAEVNRFVDEFKGEFMLQYEEILECEELK